MALNNGCHIACTRKHVILIIISLEIRRGAVEKSCGETTSDLSDWDYNTNNYDNIYL